MAAPLDAVLVVDGVFAMRAEYDEFWEAIYVAEVDPVGRADLVIDNTDLSHPRTT